MDEPLGVSKGMPGDNCRMLKKFLRVDLFEEPSEAASNVLPLPRYHIHLTTVPMSNKMPPLQDHMLHSNPRLLSPLRKEGPFAWEGNPLL
jgi:hypothetical protein